MHIAEFLSKFKHSMSDLTDISKSLCCKKAHLSKALGHSNSGYIVMLRARMFRSLIPVLMIKERNIRARNITIYPNSGVLHFVFEHFTIIPHCPVGKCEFKSLNRALYVSTFYHRQLRIYKKLYSSLSIQTFNNKRPCKNTNDVRRKLVNASIFSNFPRLYLCSIETFFAK